MITTLAQTSFSNGWEFFIYYFGAGLIFQIVMYFIFKMWSPNTLMIRKAFKE